MERKGGCSEVYMSYLLAFWDSRSLMEPHMFLTMKFCCARNTSLQLTPGQGVMWSAWG